MCIIICSYLLYLTKDSVFLQMAWPKGEDSFVLANKILTYSLYFLS